MTIIFRDFFFRVFLFVGLSLFPTGALSAIPTMPEDIVANFLEKTPYDFREIRIRTRAFLEKNNAQGENKPLKYPSSGYWHVENYLRKKCRTREEQFYGILQVLDFIERNRSHKSIERQRASLIALCELLPVVGSLPPLPCEKYGGLPADSKRIREWQFRERDALRFLLEAGWLSLYFDSELVKKDEESMKYFILEYEDHIRTAWTSGKVFYRYACFQAERFTPKYATDDAMRARLYFRLAWMYLHLNEYENAKTAAKKIPKIRGMDQSGERFCNFADAQKKKQRNRRKK